MAVGDQDLQVREGGVHIHPEGGQEALEDQEVHTGISTTCIMVLGVYNSHSLLQP